MVTKITEFHQKLKDSLTTIRKPIDSSKREVRLKKKKEKKLNLRMKYPKSI